MEIDKQSSRGAKGCSGSGGAARSLIPQIGVALVLFEVSYIGNSIQWKIRLNWMIREYPNFRNLLLG